MRFPRSELEPKLLTTLREPYGLHDLGRDALAGLVVGIVALPLAIAFAIASGVRPEQGLYTAIVAGFLISVLGGSRVQIGGPTGAFVVIVAGVVDRFGYSGLAMATLMAGVLLIVMALARLGDVIRFIPYPVTVGFTTGIALIIAGGQLGDALGFQLEQPAESLLIRTFHYLQNIGSLRPVTVMLVAMTVVIVQFWPRFNRRIPGPLLALVATTALAHFLQLDVDTIESRFGQVPTALPSFHLPDFDWNQIPDLVSPAISIALLGAIESLLSALVADGLSGGRHRSNAELFGQGIANIVSPLFGGIPATGAIARTATNVKNGGRTPIAGVVHSLVLLVILLVAGNWASMIPMATLAGILLVVAYNMSEWHVFVRLLSGPRSDVLVLLTTFALTVFIDLTVAIQAGVVLAALLFMRRMADVSSIEPIRSALQYDETETPDLRPIQLPEDVEAFEINGSFCFGAARKFTETLLARHTHPRVVILRMRHVLAIDATGLHALEDVANRLSRSGTRLFLTGTQAQPLAAMRRSGCLQRIGEENLFPSLVEASARARELLAEGVA